VLGRPNFTRPLLLQQLQAHPEAADLSREDGLRSFGALLRDGRITKVKRGQFKLAEDSHVLAEARRVAG
jgi:hypothetical protein